MDADYSRQLVESAQNAIWKTAPDVSPSEVSRVTQRLRYQATRLGLDITIRASRKHSTISFLTWRLGTKCPLEDAP